MFRRTVLLLSIGVLLSIAATPTPASGIVRVILFYNPQCRACSPVIETDLPAVLEKHSRRMDVLMVDTTTPAGAQLYRAALEYLGLEDQSPGVPMIVISDVMMAGIFQIPERLLPTVEEKLSAGGTEWPPIEGLEAYLLQAGYDTLPSVKHTPWTLFLSDQPGNSLSVLVLFLLLGSMVYSILSAFQRIPDFFAKAPVWSFLGLILLGLLVASYLSYTELTRSPVACGGISNCDAVQESRYSIIFGVLPIGVLGVLGNLGILSAWGVNRFCRGWLRDFSAIACFGMAVFGVSFSFYLTFLEPFVIGSTCLYCLSSAVVMSVLLPYTVQPVRIAIQENSS